MAYLPIAYKKLATMKTITLLLFSLFLPFAASAQSNDKGRDGLRGYGAPVIYLQPFHGGYGLYFGGKGAAILNEHLSMGGTGLGSFRLESFRGNDLAGNEQALLKTDAGYGGVFIAYALPLYKSFRLNVPLQVLWGNVSIRDEQERTIEQSGQVLLQPAIELEFHATPTLIPVFRMGYSLAFGTELQNLSNADFSGWSFGLEIRFAGPPR